jgi:hypothetical protein
MIRAIVVACGFLLAVLPIQAQAPDVNSTKQTYTVYAPLVMDTPVVEEMMFRYWAPN